MDWAVIIGIFFAGLILGFVIAIVFRKSQSKTGKELAEEVFRETDALRQANIETVVEHIKASFGNLSRDALSKSTDEFLKLAKEKFESEREINVKELEEKKSLIDQELKRITGELEKVSNTNIELESQLKSAGEQTTALRETTGSLREVLSSSQARGQWGERMAEDVLRLAGFKENVNYLKQRAIEGVGTRPDFTFLLPKDLKLNMDVKFPLDNYKKYIEADSDLEKEKCSKLFLNDVKDKIKEVTQRDYINSQQNTVDCVVMFIPNEQVFSFIYEQDSSILDNAIKEKVVSCSPITLFAVLAVIRQAVDNFALEKTSHEILSLLGSFYKQWDGFVKKMDVLGKRIGDTQKEYEVLSTTRKRQLEKPLNKIESLRTQRGITAASETDENLLPTIDETGIEKEDDS
jgi:DNA recombination protein RmuC